MKDKLVILGDGKGYLGGIARKAIESVSTDFGEKVLMIPVGVSNNRISAGEIDDAARRFSSILRDAQVHKFDRIIHFTSAVVSEECVRSDYKTAKLNEISMVDEAANGVPVTRFGITTLIGEGQKNLLAWDCYRNFSVGASTYRASRGLYRNYLTAKDLCAYISKTLESEVFRSGEFSGYKTIGGSVNIKIRDFISAVYSELASITGRTLEPVFLEPDTEEIVFKYIDLEVVGYEIEESLSAVLNRVMLTYMNC